MPQMLHKVACTRRDEANAFEFERISTQWESFLNRMRNIIKWKNEQEDKDNFRKGMQNNQIEMLQKFMEAQEKLGEKMVEAVKGTANRATTKIVKTAKVPTWTQKMSLENYLKSLSVWMHQNEDIGDEIKFQEVIESLKVNKEIKGSERF